MKIPYDLVATEASAMIMKMFLLDELEYGWDYYQAYIAACGWTDSELDQETLNRVDESWDDTIWN